MEVRLLPNSRRPGVGLAPRREASRPLLPQHARHCPVLEAGSALGFMVYAPLEPKESLYVEHEGDGRYRFVYYLQTQDGKPTPIFQVTMSLSVGGVGMVKEEVTFVGAPMLSREAALAVARVFLVPEDMGTPAGRHRPARRDELPDTIGLGHGLHADLQHDRAAGGADAGRSGRNRLVRARDRVPLRAAGGRGDYRRAQHSDRTGLLRPREEITMRPCTKRGGDAIEASRQEFNRHKAAAVQKTSYGLSYSPHYLRQSRAQKSKED